MGASLLEWFPVPDYEGLYEVTRDGRVRSLDRVTGGSAHRRIKGRPLKPSLNTNGYPFVTLCKDGTTRQITVHRIVTRTFLGPCPEGLEVCHGDGDSLNNSIDNLRYDTRSANAYDRVKHGTHPAAAKTHCIHGHPFDELNTRPRPKGGRTCIACERASNVRKLASNREYMRAKRAARKAMTAA